MNSVRLRAMHSFIGPDGNLIPAGSAMNLPVEVVNQAMRDVRKKQEEEGLPGSATFLDHIVKKYGSKKRGNG